MLEQAILDAKELKEAAIKNAQQALIEKYSNEFEGEVEKLLEQAAPPMAAPAAAPATPGAAPVDPEKAKADSDAKSNIFDKLEYAYADGEVIGDKVYKTGVVEIDLDSISQYSFKKNQETPEQMALQELKQLSEDSLLSEELDEEMSDEEDYDEDSDTFPYGDDEESDEDDEDDYEDDESEEEDEDLEVDFEDDEDDEDDDLDSLDIDDEDDEDLDIEDEEFSDDEDFEDEDLYMSDEDPNRFEIDYETDQDDADYDPDADVDDEEDEEEFDDEEDEEFDDEEESEEDESDEEDEEDEIDELEEGDEEKGSAQEEAVKIVEELIDQIENALNVLDTSKHPGLSQRLKRMLKTAKGKKEELQEAIKLDYQRSGQRSPFTGMFKEEAEHDVMLAELQAQIAELEQETEELQESNKKLKNGLKNSIKLNESLNDKLAKFEQKLLESRFLNYKLLYTNKALSDASLNERQKNKIAESISNAKTAEEVKLLYETLKSTMRDGTSNSRSPKSLSEAVERRSSSLLLRGSRAEPKKHDDYAERMKKLAGLA